MKTNLKVLMLGLLIGCVNLTSNACGLDWLTGPCQNAWDKSKAGCSYVTTLQNWKDNKFYFGLGTAAIAGVTAGAAFLAYKKIQAKKAKARLTNGK